MYVKTSLCFKKQSPSHYFVLGLPKMELETHPNSTVTGDENDNVVLRHYVSTPEVCYNLPLEQRKRDNTNTLFWETCYSV